MGVIPHLVDDGLSILQYADDTIIFLDHDLKQTKNMKLLLCAFEQLSGLKINFHKSEIFCYGAAKEMEDEYTTLFSCNAGEYPFRYMRRWPKLWLLNLLIFLLRERCWDLN